MKPENSDAGRLPPQLDLTVLSRNPIRLRAETETTIRGLRGAPGAHRSLADPVASIIVLTHDNLVFTKLCLESVLQNTRDTAYEVIVVDNGSSDGTVEYLREVAASHAQVKLLLNAENLGFARGNNQALATARGRSLVLLNNDTVVPPGWLPRLLAHLDDEQVGLVGPVTNRIGNEAQIDTGYRSYGEFVELDRRRAETHAATAFEPRMLTMFCLAMRSDVHRRLGPLDERFEVGMLEDDDYSWRAVGAGYRLRCAEDVVVHHFGGASFGKLVPTGEYGRLLRENQRRFADKWNRPWEAYDRRPSAQYRELAEQIRELVEDALPVESTVAIVSRGDDGLLEVGPRRALHFPLADDGGYAGFYPADSGEAIAHLERVRHGGAEFLLFPRTAFWWLEHYAGFRDHLESRYTVAHRSGACCIYSLERS